MTVYATNPMTLAVECHKGEFWICAIEHGKSRKLAHFISQPAVDIYKQLANQRDRYMHESGRSGL